jgi:hypothetical protein
VLSAAFDAPVKLTVKAGRYGLAIPGSSRRVV